MPIITPPKGPAGPTFTGGTVTAPVVMADANAADVSLAIEPAAGATAAATDQIELYDDVGNILGFVDAAGSAGLTAAAGQTTNIELQASRVAYLGRTGTGLVGFKIDSAGEAIIQPDTGQPVFVQSANGNLAFAVTDAGTYTAGSNTALPDAGLAAGSFQLWLDSTPGATKLMVKAKDSGGTVRTAAINLT